MGTKVYKKKRNLLFISITALGISSIITQIIVMREFLNIFSGNELVFGLVLGSWLLLTGIGSYIGKFIERIKDNNRIRLLVISQIIIAILPFAYVILIRTFRNIIYLPGRLISFPEILVSAVILLAPYCIISGALLTLACIIFPSKKKEESIGQVYFIDNIGDIIGGVLFSFILVYLMSTFGIIYVIMIINLIASLLVSIFLLKRKIFSIISSLSIIIFIILFLTINLDVSTMKNLYPGQTIVFQKNSPYGNVVVTEQEGQYNFFENGVALFSTENTVSNEETIHYSLSHVTEPQDVLLISGGISGTITEILKYNVDVDYLELDPVIIEAGRLFANFNNHKKINVINTDGRRYVKQAEKKYDAIIIDLPNPNSAQINRFYTDEFFSEAKRKMNNEGVISLSLTGEPNYLSKEGRKLNSVVYNTLRNNFDNIIIIPGNNYYYIASDKELDYDIGKNLENKKIKTEFVNDNYLNGILTDDRIEYINNAVKESTNLNRDFRPVAYYHQLVYWASQYKTNLIIFLIILLTITVYTTTRLKPVTFAIFTTGFAASALEIVILIAFQIIHGYVYSKIGIIITAFMIGLGIGAYITNKNLKRFRKNELVILEFMIAAFAIMLPLIIILINKTNNNAILTLSDYIIFPVLTIIIGALTGAEFPLAAKLFFKTKADTAARLYSADLVGAFIGAVIISSLLIPLVGIVYVCVIVAGLNVLSGIILLQQRPVRYK